MPITICADCSIVAFVVLARHTRPKHTSQRQSATTTPPRAVPTHPLPAHPRHTAGDALQMSQLRRCQHFCNLHHSDISDLVAAETANPKHTHKSVRCVRTLSDILLLAPAGTTGDEFGRFQRWAVARVCYKQLRKENMRKNVFWPRVPG